MPDIQQVGREAIEQKRLRELRKRFDISVSCQAFLIGVNPVAIPRWEAGKVKPSRMSLRKVGAWYLRVSGNQQVVDTDFSQFIHVTTASQKLAMSYPSLLRHCDDMGVRTIQFPGLGLFLNRSDLALLGDEVD